MSWITSFAARFPKTVIAVTLAVTAGAMALMVRPGIEMDANPYPLNKSHPSMVAFHELKTDFTGTLETALIHLRHPQSVFNAATLRRISAITEKLEEVSLITEADEAPLAAIVPASGEEVRGLLTSVLEGGITRDDDVALVELLDWSEANPGELPALAVALEEIQLRLYPVKEVTSLSNVENIVARNDELVVGKVYESIPQGEAEWRRMRDSVMSNEVFRKVMVSEDERSTGIQVELYIPDDRSDLMYAMDRAIRDIMEDTPGEEETHVAGFPLLSATFMNSMQQDNGRLFPVVILLVATALFVIFRGLSGVVLPMAVAVISVIWTLGIMVLSGVPLNMMTTMLPVFLIAIGVADGVHLVSEFRDQYRRLGNRREAVRATMDHMTLPVIMTSITTAVGFFALAFTDVDVIREFGIFVAIGVLAAMVFSLTFIPAALTLGRGGRSPSARPGATRRFQRLDSMVLNLLVRLSAFSMRRNRWVIAVSAVLVLIGFYGMTRIKADNDFTTYFDQEWPIIRSIRAIDEYMAGSNIISVLVKAPEQDGDPFKKPEYLAAVEGLQKHLAINPIVGKSLSLVDVIKRINLVMHDNDPAYNRLPAKEEVVATNSGDVMVPGRQVVAQYLLLYENGGGENLSDNVDSGFTTLNVSVLLNSQNAIRIGELMEDTQRYAAANMPPGMQIAFAGSAEMAITTNNEIVRIQIVSLAISMVVIFFLLMLQFRSLGKGLLAMLPLAITVILNFGIIGLAGIDLNIAIAVISSIVIGISVDFAIHYLSRLQVELDKGVPLQTALAETMRASGKAIAANAVVVALGFLALALSDLYPLQLMGLMIFQTLLISAFIALVVIPAAATFFNPRFVRAAATEGQAGDLATEAGLGNS